MCPPTYFDVVYSINPWMEPTKPTEADLAMVQWERLRGLLHGLGHRVELIAPRPGLPDMVFAANGAMAIGGKALAAHFRYPQRSAVASSYLDWFREQGFAARAATHVNEGEGDFLITRSRILAGCGFRTDRRAHAEVEELFGRPVIPLTLVDPRFYHLDTALAVLDDNEVMYYPAAFTAASQNVLSQLYPTALRASRADAEVFGVNAVSDGRHVVLAQQATGLADQLSQRGFLPIGVDLSELLKAGGGAKCCALELHED
jgi:N-dimethylarginine dimethylaminohydrolase